MEQPTKGLVRDDQDGGRFQRGHRGSLLATARTEYERSWQHQEESNELIDRKFPFVRFIHLLCCSWVIYRRNIWINVESGYRKRYNSSPSPSIGSTIQVRSSVKSILPSMAYVSSPMLCE